jgi:shikimate kinase
MPGSGKSTLGRRIASLRGMQFVDTDQLIEQRYKCSLEQLVSRKGPKYFSAVEEQIICSLEFDRHLISTGGSAVYSNAAMQHLTEMGPVVYLHVSLPTAIKRIAKAPNRGIAKQANMSLESLYHQRLPLYRNWANVVINNDRPLTRLQLEKIASQMPITASST